MRLKDRLAQRAKVLEAQNEWQAQFNREVAQFKFEGSQQRGRIELSKRAGVRRRGRARAKQILLEDQA